MVDKGKFAYLLGALLALVGSLLPWRCYGDIVWFCAKGIEPNLDIVRLTLINTNRTMLAIVIVVISSILMIQLDVSAVGREAIAFAAVLILISLAAINQFIIDNGGLAVVILTGITIWSVFRAPALFKQSSAVALASALLLVAWTKYNLAIVLINQIGEKEIIGGTATREGLPIVFIGSLILLVQSIEDQRLISRHAG